MFGQKMSSKIGAAFSILAVLGASFAAAPVVAENERYVPGIWIDPDGCEHWVMDDGLEGYMDLKVDRKGLPTCYDIEACGVMNSDQLFQTNKYAISATGRERLKNFFSESSATGFIVVGHTDSRASDDYNLRLSYNRANAVAKVAMETGARVLDIRGMGERMPRATNGTDEGMQANRRVEILCVR